MIEQIRRFLTTASGKVTAVALCTLLLGFGVYSVKAFIHGDTPNSAFTRMYIDTATGKPFSHQPVLGETQPIHAPSGQETGMPAEACYWTADGKIRTEPFWVLLNSEKNPPEEEPTFCPDCGRIVFGHNPKAEPGMTPPPTRAEWFSAHARPSN